MRSPRKRSLLSVNEHFEGKRNDKIHFLFKLFERQTGLEPALRAVASYTYTPSPWKGRTRVACVSLVCLTKEQAPFERQTGLEPALRAVASYTYTPSPWKGRTRVSCESLFALSKLSGKRGSNPRPSAWEADALPTELLPQLSSQIWE